MAEIGMVNIGRDGDNAAHIVALVLAHGGSRSNRGDISEQDATAYFAGDGHVF